MTHIMHVEWEAGVGFRVRCSCGWLSDAMGQGDAYATKARGLKDVGHAAYVSARGVIG